MDKQSWEFNSLPVPLNEKAPSLSDEREFLRRKIYSKAIHFGNEIIYDFRELLTDVQCAEIAGRLMWEAIKSFKPEVLIGPGYGAAPLLMATGIAALKQGVALEILMVRDNRKGHNRKKWIEGRRPCAGSRAVMLDDYLGMGSAVKLVDQALREENIEINLLCLGIFFDTWEPLGSRQLSMSRFPVVALFKRHDIGMSRDCCDAKPPLMKGKAPEFLAEKIWWRYDLHQPSDYFVRTSPVISDNAVFVADNQSQIWRHNLFDGSIEWKYQSLYRPTKGIVQLLQHHDGSLVFGCYDGTVVRLDARTGEIIWRWRQDSSIHATPEVDLGNNRLFINTEQWNNGRPHGFLYAMEWSTGKVLWKHKHAYWPPGTPVYSESTGTVVATCNDETLVCVDADTGMFWWSGKTHGLVRGQPVVHGNRVFLVTERGFLHCFELYGGRECWVARCGSGHFHNFLRIIEGCIAVLDNRRNLFFFDIENGELRWMNSLRSRGAWRPVKYGRYEIVLSEAGEIAIFDPRLQLKIREDSLGGWYGQPPGIGQDHIAFASNNQGVKVYKINPFYSESGR